MTDDERRTHDHAVSGRSARGTPFAVTILVALAAVVHPVVTIAQDTTPPAQRPPDTRVPARARVAIDGAKHPERIPDDAALYGLIPLWAELLTGATEQERRFQLLTRRMALQPADMQILRAELTRIRELLAASRARMQALGDGAAVRGEVDITRHHSVTTYQRLLKLLSADGASKLQQHLQYVKARTTVYQTGPDSPGR